MRRLALLVVTALGGAFLTLVLPASPATADDTVVVTDLYFDDESLDRGPRVMSCESLELPVSSPLGWDITRPTGSVAGTRAWQLANTGTGPDAVGLAFDTDSLLSNPVVGMYVRTEAQASGVSYVAYLSPTSPSGTFWVGRSALSVSGSAEWQNVELAPLTYTWRQFVLATGKPDGNQGGSHSILDFAEMHGGDGPANFRMGFGCGGGSVLTDLWHHGAPGDVRSYDLEGYHAHVHAGADSSTVTAGGPATLYGYTYTELNGQTTSDSPSPPGQVELQASTGGGPFVTVRSVPIDEDGRFSAQVKPVRNTDYRFRYPESDAYIGAVSPTMSVTVRAVVSIKSPTKVKLGKDLVVTGKVVGARKGTLVTLWRSSGSKPVKLASSTVQADGSYRVARRMKQLGKLSVRVTVATSADGLGARSAVRTVSVTRTGRRMIAARP